MCVDFEDAALRELVANLAGDGFDPYLTSVGGSGLGILSPYGQHHEPSAPRPVTPPETPNEASTRRDAEGDVSPDPLRGNFESQSISDLAAWVEGRGKWLFV